MGLHNLPHICEELIAGGLQPSTPAAAVQQGTVRGQRAVISDLNGLAAAVREAKLASPSIVVIGEVVNQRVESCAPEPAAVEMPIPLAQG
jgi:uroporphyrin-III C-methyltransferase